jgi:hypothetical protein
MEDSIYYDSRKCDTCNVVWTAKCKMKGCLNLNRDQTVIMMSIVQPREINTVKVE